MAVWCALIFGKFHSTYLIESGNGACLWFSWFPFPCDKILAREIFKSGDPSRDVLFVIWQRMRIWKFETKLWLTGSMDSSAVKGFATTRPSGPGAAWFRVILKLPRLFIFLLGLWTFYVEFLILYVDPQHYNWHFVQPQWLQKYRPATASLGNRKFRLSYRTICQFSGMGGWGGYKNWCKDVNVSGKCWKQQQAAADFEIRSRLIGECSTCCLPSGHAS